MPTSFVAVYRGTNVQSARLIGLTADPQVVAQVSAQILAEEMEDHEPDPIVASVNAGRKKALRLLRRKATHGKA